MISTPLRGLLALSVGSLLACGLPAPVGAGGAAGLHPLGGKASAIHAFQANHADNSGPPPATADISQYNPAVGNQGQIGDCTTWAFGYGLGGYLAAQAGSPQEFAPMFLFTQVAPSGTTDFGISTQEAFTLMQTTGLDTAADYDASAPAMFTDNGASVPGFGDDAAANDTVDPPSASAKQNALHFLLTSYTTVYAVAPQGTGVCPGYPGGTVPIQNAIAGGSPVVVTIPVPPEFDNYDGVNPIVPPTATETSRGEHALLCTKYDAAGLWCQNSWGTSWGKQGWGQLAWSFVEQCVVETDTATGMIPTQTTVDNPPTAIIGAPADGSTVSGGVTVTAQITPGTNPVVSVAIFGNGVQYGSQGYSADGAAWSMDTTQLPNGSYSLTVVATDSVGVQGTSAAITVNISNTMAAAQPPTVTFIAPVDQATISGAPTVQVGITPGAAPLTDCTLTANGTVVGQEDGSSPSFNGTEFDVVLDTVNLQLPDGPLTLVASCTDSSMLVGTAQITVTVGN